MAAPAKSLSLHKKQMEVYSSKHRFRVVVAGRRWGKTALSRVLIIKMAQVKKRKIWYVAPTYRMAKQIMWIDLLDAIPKAWIRKVNETTLTITLVNQTRIELKGADKPDSLRGVGIHFLVLDEFQDMNEETWTQVLRPTLADTGGHAIFIGTPKAYNYLHTVYQLGQRGATYVDARGRTRVNEWMSWQFPTITSPFIPVSELEAARRDMDEKSFKQEFEASFETMSGRVYYPFDRAVHVGKYPFNPKLPIWIGMDFNIDPMSTVIFQPQPSGELWAVDEIVQFGSNTEEICEAIDAKYWRHQNQIVIYPDPAGGQRQHARGETDLDILREKGFRRIKYRRKHPLVADRVNAVNRMLRSADNTVRLRIDEGCKHFIKSLEQTIYKPGSRDVDKAAGTEHSADAAGYCIDLEFPVRRIEVGGLSV
ncbi:terminase [Ralstonia pickettii]|uniref:Terminase n=1 Tax=Ralstonia pickettii TaxID=329 RepID=A0A2N4TXW4_RALPI|nr:phage terminase large subunit [Ralstonia pickettii]PLC44554.1 terminase [Ralstonia pickettii]